MMISGQTWLQHIIDLEFNNAMVDRVYALPLATKDPTDLNEDVSHFLDFLHCHGLIRELNTTLPYSPYMHVHIVPSSIY